MDDACLCGPLELVEPDGGRLPAPRASLVRRERTRRAGRPGKHRNRCVCVSGCVYISYLPIYLSIYLSM